MKVLDSSCLREVQLLGLGSVSTIAESEFGIAIAVRVFMKLLGWRVHVVFVVSIEQAEHQSVGHVEQEWPVLTSVSSSLNLRSVLCQVDVTVSRQIGSRMSHVPEKRIDEHEARFEGVKVRLVPEDRAQLHQTLHAGDIHTRRACCHLYEPENAAYEDQRHT